MLGVVRRLERSGARAIAIPCNTAHRWQPEIQRRTQLPVFHIVDAVIDAMIADGAQPGDAVGLLATTGTLEAGIYAERLAARGMRLVTPAAGDQEDLVMAGIRAVKGGDLRTGAQRLAAAADTLLARGASRIVMGCTEVPPALAGAGRGGGTYVDATDALARACVDWALAPAAETADAAAA